MQRLNIGKESKVLINMNKPKIMLAGIGGFGVLYLNRLIELYDKNEVDVVGLVEPYPEHCVKLKEIEERKWKIYKNLDDFYNKEKCDLACISTPTHFHTKMIIKALENGSNVLCEKPLTGDVRDIDKIIEARNKYRKFVMIGYQWSYSNAILSMKKDVLSGLYGTPKFLKTIVLWPRDKLYFKRGTGWAGKIKGSNGELILDSVASNATAHYLHNIFFTLGKSIEQSADFEKVEAKLYRANDIENFDTAIIKCEFNNGHTNSLFIASHATEKAINPTFEYRFSNGVISFSEDQGNEIIGKLNNGVICNYGNPFENEMLKLDYAINNLNTNEPFVVCGIETASVHTKCIAECSKIEISTFSDDLLKNDNNRIYVNGLYEKLLKTYCSEDNMVI